MQSYRFQVLFKHDKDGRITAICPSLQGCYTEGETLKEARLNIREAIKLHIESRRTHGEPVVSG